MSTGLELRGPGCWSGFEVLEWVLLGCISANGMRDTVRGVFSAEGMPKRFGAMAVFGGAIGVETTASMFAGTDVGDSSRSRSEDNLFVSGVALPRA